MLQVPDQVVLWGAVQDWGVHKLVCREGEVVRKRKGGKQARKQKGSDHFDCLVAFMEKKLTMGKPQ